MKMADAMTAPIDADSLSKLAGYNLKKLREKLGWSRKRLSDFLGVKEDAVSKNELGTTFPKVPNLILLADLYGVTVDEILGRKTLLKMRLQRDIAIEGAVKRLSKYGQLDKVDKGGYVLTLSELKSDNGKIEEITRAVTFPTAELLIKFVDEVTNTALDSSNTFEQVLNFRVNHIAKD